MIIPWPEFRLQLLRASFKVWRPLTCIEHSPEFRKALHVSPIVVTVRVESIGFNRKKIIIQGLYRQIPLIYQHAPPRNRTTLK